ncbi:MAG: CD225/dispanin family protein [Victivallales bacterium]|nr:CD225/dispanin family protein [Victivallales bacterium]
MSFIFTCPHCGQKMECSDAWSGKQARCPACDEMMNLSSRSVEKPASPSSGEPAGSASELSLSRPASAPSFSVSSRSSVVLEGKAVGRPPFNSHLFSSILLTIFCCPPSGIVAIVYAVKAIYQRRIGNDDLASAYAKRAAIWMWLGPIAWGLLIIVLCIFGK